jgi:predicted glycogen debranching enzyme
MHDPCRRIAPDGDLDTKEFLVANGLGGFSSATLLGTLSRRYHGVLVAALATPFGRTVMLNQIDEILEAQDGRSVPLHGEESRTSLVEFRLELGLPVWLYRIGEVVIEKRLVMRHLQNTVDVVYTLTAGGPVRLKLRPWASFRGLEAAVDSVAGEAHVFARQDLYDSASTAATPPSSFPAARAPRSSMGSRRSAATPRAARSGARACSRCT